MVFSGGAMKDLSDQDLISGIKDRFKKNRRALHDLREVTEKLEATNRKLQESEALKSHFLSNIRNEINNPLTAIMGLAARLMNGGADPETTREAGRMIFGEAFHLDFQLRNIFTAAELEAGEAAPAYARVDVVAIIDGIIGQLDHWTGQKGIAISSTAPAYLFFTTDAQKFQMMVINLLANAVEFSPPGESVDISADVVDGALRCVVRDSGPGIEPELRETVFDRFRQLDRGATKNHRGHGLGLSVTRALVEIMEGRIELDGAPGEGCSVSLRLPEPEIEVDVFARDGNMFLFEGAEKF
jgi:signal transduction histidine kinase